MVLPREQDEAISTKTQLGKPDDVIGFPIIGYDESITIEELPTINKTNTLGHVWIIGSSTNSIIGTWTDTEDGQQLVIGPDGDGGRDLEIIRVVSPNKTFRERFIDEELKDSGTANWDTTTKTLIFTGSQTMQSLSAFLNSTTITNARMVINTTTNLTLKLSANGGSNFETVTNNVSHTFTTTGTDLRWKLESSGNVTVDNIRIFYNE